MGDRAAGSAPNAERRGLEARAARDRLASLLGLPPGQLRHISRETADAMIAAVATARRHTGPPDRWVVGFRLTALGGYAGELADLARWQREKPEDHLRRRGADIEITVHITAPARSAASLFARGEVLQIFSTRHYRLAELWVEKQL